MPLGQILLIAVAVLLLLIRIGIALRKDDSVDGPTYDEPKLKLDEDDEQPHELFGELRSTLDVDHDADERYLRRNVKADAVVSDAMPVSRKILLAAVAVWLFVAIPYAHDSLSWLRLLTPPAAEAETGDGDDAPTSMGGVMPSASVGQDQVPGQTTDQQARAKELEGNLDARNPLAKKTVNVPPVVKVKKAPLPIDDPTNKALAKFFDKLMRVENKEEGATARVLYYGDSIVASDFVSGKLRRMLQDRFGDAGHGYTILANAWKGFFHIDVSRVATAAWLRSTCVGPYAKDGLYGLGCASFVTKHPKVWSEFGTAKGKWGKNVSRFEVEYLKQPGGGGLRLHVDGKVKETISTDGDTAVAWHTVTVPDGPHKLKVETVGDGPARVFGIRMERDVPGVTLSALGITGARARFLDKQDDAHWAKVLKQAKPDLVCLAFGSNEIHDGSKYPMEDYERTVEAVMEQVEKALPDASFMLVGPPDMARKGGGSVAYVPIMVKAQRRIAKKRGWAFWNQFEAMGGGGSMWSWVQSDLGNPDLVHPTGHGGSVLGRLQYWALMEAYEKHKAARR